MNIMLNAARQYLAMGLHPIPCAPRSKRPLVKWEPYQTEPPHPDEIEQWWTDWPDANVALVLGRGTFAVDLDGGLDAERLLFDRGILLPGAPRSKTAHGAHVFLAGSVPDRVGLLSTKGAKPQVDIRGVGYVVAPPSVHPDGPVYEWTVPLTLPLPQAPETLLALIRGGQGGTSQMPSDHGWVIEALHGVREGQRDYTCTKLAGYFLGKGIPFETVEALLLDTFAAACTPPVDPATVRKCVRSIAKRERDHDENMPAPIAERLDVVLSMWTTERGAGPPTLARSPFYGLNRYLGGGFSAGELVYIGARPGVCKTALALEIARAVAKDGQAVLIVSREMVNTALGRRMVTQESKIPTTTLKRHEPLPLEDAAALDRALLRLRPLPIWLSDRAVSIEDIAHLVRHMTAEVPLGLVLVDYLQLVRAPREIKDRRLQVESVSLGLKSLALEYRFPVVCLSSLARPERGVDRRPSLADLRESGELEHDADVVLLLHRHMLESKTECIIAKNREGSPGIVELAFDGRSLTFTEEGHDGRPKAVVQGVDEHRG